MMTRSKALQALGVAVATVPIPYTAAANPKRVTIELDAELVEAIAYFQVLRPGQTPGDAHIARVFELAVNGRGFGDIAHTYFPVIQRIYDAEIRILSIRGNRNRRLADQN